MKVRTLMCILAVLLLLTGCGSAATQDSMIENKDMYVEMETGAENGMLTVGDTGSTQLPSENRKWIITMDISAETEDLDALLAGLDETVAALEGYIQERSIFNGSAYSDYTRYRNASMTVRIPAQRVDEFTQQVARQANVTRSDRRLSDVTLQYVAVESRMNALRAEEARLLELMEQAENMSDLLQIEGRLTDVRYELESVTSQLRIFDNQVDYATVYVYISEVQEYTVVEEQTVWQRIGTGFMHSVRGVGRFLVDAFVFLVTGIPYFLLAALITVPVVLILRKRKKKKEAPTEE